MKERAISAERLVEVGTEFAARANQIKENVVEALEERVDTARAAARRTLRHSQNTAEELLDNAAHEVRQHPFQSVGFVFGVGLAAGLAIGWLTARKG